MDTVSEKTSTLVELFMSLSSGYLFLQTPLRRFILYAHRRCIQRWCNEKGNTVCEICHQFTQYLSKTKMCIFIYCLYVHCPLQPFKPGYTAPPPIFQIGRIPVNFRGNWEISRRDLNNSRFIAVVSPDRNFIDPESDEYAASTARSELYCRSVAIIFMFLLVLRHVLPVIFSERVDYSLPLFLLLLLRACGVILPIYIILRAVNAIQSCRRLQESPEISDTSSDEEAGLPTLPHQARVMRIH
ncbi:hypothetical protein RHGRI_026225 [Rhododendron griersonianum]|uniref:RING-CH-type domain-containing protein n=1 Tax=Rhododendron griersonianum TaxID=479676 RepID=A0AAV6IS41_9ERIC|nr:hypothetical protein RHGRI_026225 [Rhododendron griersonianum]